MNYKNPIFWIKCFYYKLFPLNQPHLFGDEKSLGGNIQPLPNFLIVEINLNIVQSEKKHFQSNIYANIRQRESFIKKTGYFIFVIYPKEDNDYTFCFQSTTIDFLSTDISLANAKTRLSCGIWLNCIDFTG